MKIVENQRLDEERALYGSNGILVRSCTFDGEADGESALKESRNVQVENCFWNLRYPFWHNDGLKIRGTELTKLCRAALWYSRHIDIGESKLHGIKALRECRDVTMDHCDVISPEFGWSVTDMRMRDTRVESEYFMMNSRNLNFSRVELKGKYSFQYVENAVIEDCDFDTKDSFWHGKNIIVKDSVIKGEYLGWYSENLTFINCRISGTQPFCYCRNLKLVNCEMLETDLAFEKSQVEAEITTPVASIKNPLSGRITVPAVGEIIMDDPAAKGEILIKAPVGKRDSACA